MREIDKYVFPYVDEINYILDFNKLKYKENCVYTNIVTGKDYRYINGNFEELNDEWIFSSGLIDNEKFKRHLIRFLKENHILDIYIKACFNRVPINRNDDIFNNSNFELNNIFKVTTDVSLKLNTAYYHRYQMFNRLYWKVIAKIK